MDHHEKMRLLRTVLTSEKPQPARRLLMLIVVPLTLVLATLVLLVGAAVAMTYLVATSPALATSPLVGTLLALGGVGTGAGVAAVRQHFRSSRIDRAGHGERSPTPVELLAQGELPPAPSSIAT
jgi:hypothetical protein